MTNKTERYFVVSESELEKLARGHDTFDITGDTTEVNHKALARKGAAYDKLMKGDEG